MRDGEWPWLVRDGRLRTPWAVLLFVALFGIVFVLELLLLGPLLARLPDLATAPLPALLAQGLMVLAPALLAGGFMLRFVDGRPIRDLGFPLRPGIPRELAWGLGIGAAAPVLVVALLAMAGAYRYTTEPGTLAGWLAVAASGLLWLAVPAVAEEAAFRGYLLRRLADGAGPVPASLVTSGLFAAAHGANPEVSTFGLVNIFLAGLMLAAAVLWTGSLWFASAVHLGWNWATAAALDLPVSGLDAFDPPLYDGHAAGPPWVTGGAFGLEGGAAGTAAAGVALLLVARYAGRRRAGREPANGSSAHGRSSDGDDR